MRKAVRRRCFRSNDIFGVQDEISQQIALALKVILTAEKEQRKRDTNRARVSTAD